MKINAIVNLINRKLAGELLSYYELSGFMDDVIDDINDELGSTFPVFTDIDNTTDEYDFFPDRWIRQVVVYGTAWYFYVMDEEGISNAQTYQQLYFDNLFKMTRDYFDDVPEEYVQGYVDPTTLEEDEEAPESHEGTLGEDTGEDTVIINGSNWRI